MLPQIPHLYNAEVENSIYLLNPEINKLARDLEKFLGYFDTYSEYPCEVPLSQSEYCAFSQLTSAKNDIRPETRVTPRRGNCTQHESHPTRTVTHACSYICINSHASDESISSCMGFNEYPNHTIWAPPFGDGLIRSPPFTIRYWPGFTDSLCTRFGLF